MSLLASQYIRAGQTLKGYFEEGRVYLSCFKLLFLAHYLVGKQGSFFPRKISPGKFSGPGVRQTSAKSRSALESYIQQSSNGAHALC